MRIGLIGLGRIGAFHADTLAALDTVDELVVTKRLVGMISEADLAEHLTDDQIAAWAESVYAKTTMR